MEKIKTRRFDRNAVTFLIWTAILLVLPLILHTNYMVHLCVNSLIFVLLAQGLNLILGYCGQMSLGQAGFYAIGAYAFTLGMQKMGMGWWVALLFAIVLTTVIGLIIGAIGLRNRGSAFIIITILFANIVHLVLMNWIDMTNGQAGITGIAQPSIFGHTITSKLGTYYFILVFVVIMQFFVNRLVDSKIGRAFIAVKQDESLATSLGISPYHFSLAAFGISVALAALAGALRASYSQMASPEMSSFNSIMLYIIMMTVLGGRGTLWGPVLGAFIFTFLPEYLRFADTLRLPIFGAILILLVLFIPDGLIPTFFKILRKQRARKAEAAAPAAVEAAVPAGADESQEG